MCIHGVGGSPHPDYLLGHDTLDNFNARGLTAWQWMGWKLYYKHFLTPMQRADLNTGLIRLTQIGMTPGVKRVPELKDLMMTYGDRKPKEIEVRRKLTNAALAANAAKVEVKK